MEILNFCPPLKIQNYLFLYIGLDLISKLGSSFSFVYLDKSLNVVPISNHFLAFVFL